MNHSIIFIHIGQALPDYLGIALRQARLFNPNCRIILLASAQAIINSPFNRNLNLEVVPCESLDISEKHQQFLESSNLDRKFRDGFWLRTTERFYYLEALMEKLELQHIFHLENDNLLYIELATLLPTFARYYSGIAATFDAPDRCVPGFVYIQHPQALSQLTQFINELTKSQKNQYNDMALLALFKQRYDTPLIDFLPIVDTNYPHPLQNQMGCEPQKLKDYANHFDDFESIFDAAAIGQYLGGIDPANSNSKDSAGFINETSVFNPSFYEYSWILDSNRRRVPAVVNNNTVFRINNLHIHSKNLEPFSSWNK